MYETLIEFWHWLVLAAILGALDMLAQSGFFLWLGVAALSVGLLVFFLPDLSWQGQLLAFAGMSIGVVMATRLVVRRGATPSDRPTLNRRGQQYVGQLVVLESPIVNGRGRAFVGDSLWTVEGSDSPVGATVRVVGSDGTLLHVERP
jgi:membrane protein implicated in regulation of membrane protease activity